MALSSFSHLQREIVACEACPRLREHCRAVAQQRRSMYRDWEYWGRPVPSFGAPPARLLIVGLAPGAHGANRTGRMFTGDSSGDWLYEALYRFGFATKKESISRDDGLQLVDTVITAAAHCAPPQNKPTRAELENCRPFLLRELEIVQPRLVLCLGRIAFEAIWKVLRELPRKEREEKRPKPTFRHNELLELTGGHHVLLSYHPSRQNTNTGRLTRLMWHAVFEQARHFLDGV